MSSEVKALTTCPACARVTLAEHCPSPNCNWHHCRNRDCDGMFDLTRGRGHVLTEDGKLRRRWTRGVA